MRSNPLAFATIGELAPLLAKRKISPVELTEMCLARIEESGARLHAFITVTAESALAAARIAERDIGRGNHRGLLHGIPIALKDNLWTRGVRTTAGSTILREFVPEEDASVVRALRRAGAIFVGKTNMHEFAYGITGENPHYGATRNPWDRERISGGSSGGSAVATATGMCFASIGTDTGGSCRVPAAFCGIVGLKPTFGRISRYGVVPLAFSHLDHVGILARSIHDSRILLNTLSGYDRRDSGSAHQSRKHLGGAKARTPLHWRLGWPKEFFWEQLDPAVRNITEGAVQSLVKAGAVVEEVSLPTLTQGIEAANLVGKAEALAFHQQSGYFPARAAEYGMDMRTRLEQGKEVRAVDYLEAQETIRQSRAEFATALGRVDVIVAPTTPMAAPLLGAERVILNGIEESVRGALVGFSRPANYTGLPAISVPCGFTTAGLPVGLQLIGRAFEEGTLLRIADTYECQHRWRTTHPSLG